LTDIALEKKVAAPRSILLSRRAPTHSKAVLHHLIRFPTLLRSVPKRILLLSPSAPFSVTTYVLRTVRWQTDKSLLRM